MAREDTDLAALPLGPGTAGEAPLRASLAQALVIGVADRLGHHPALAAEARSLAEGFLGARSTRAVAALERRLKTLWIDLELRGEDDRALVQGLLRLVRLLLGGLAEQATGQARILAEVQAAEDLLARPPGPAEVARLERTVRDILYRQAAMRGGLDEARDALKALLASFLDRIATVTEATDAFQHRAALHAERIAEAEDVFALSAIIAEVARDTRDIHLDMRRTRDELAASRRDLTTHRDRIARLEQTVVRASGHMHEDVLTRLLNRRGLARAFAAESARAARRNEPLCLAAIEIEGFERLEAGGGKARAEAAIRLVSGALRASLRPSDVTARLGGPQFVALLPDADPGGARTAMARVQARLATRQALAADDGPGPTIGAGIAQWREGEDEAALLARAVRALRKACDEGPSRIETEQPGVNR